MDKEMYFSMSKDSNNLVIDRGIALHKMIRMATLATAGGGYLNFMGNEFGHPEWIDFPREGNNWSYKYARRQWHLVDDKSLRYHQLGDFDKAMIELAEEFKLLNQAWFQPLLLNRSDQIMAFERGELLFVFNFHPTQSYTDYGIQISPGKFRIVLNTDSPDYGGFDRVDENLTYFCDRGGMGLSSPHYFRGYFPSRTAIVYRRIPVKSVYDI
jgi:1,4-alpha-glucan branching enzyme